MPWVIAAVVTVGIIGLTCAFILNARALKRDLDQRRDAFRARLEHDANAIVDLFLQSNEGECVRPGRRAMHE